MNRELARMRLRMAESLLPEDRETIVHGEGKTSTVRGRDAAERERLKMFVLEHRQLLYGLRRAVPCGELRA